MSLGAMFALAGSTGFRKAEVALPSGCAFGGAVYADPPPQSSLGPSFPVETTLPSDRPAPMPIKTEPNLGLFRWRSAL